MNEEAKIGYSSHGEFCTWAEMKETEVDERGNYTKADVHKWERKYKLKDDSQVIWITRSRRMAYAYAALAGQYDEIMALPEEQLEDYVEEHELGELSEFNLEDGVLIPESDDGDNGFIFIWRPADARSHEPELDFLRKLMGMSKEDRERAIG